MTFERKITQFNTIQYKYAACAGPNLIVHTALCDDNTMWILHPDNVTQPHWERLPSIPQGLSNISKPINPDDVLQEWIETTAPKKREKLRLKLEAWIAQGGNAPSLHMIHKAQDSMKMYFSEPKYDELDRMGSFLRFIGP